MLIILSKSPFGDSFASVLKIAFEIANKGEKVGILHIQDACITLTLPDHLEEITDERIKLYGLKADCEARGLSKKINKSVRIIDYDGWVKLVMNEYDKIVSWL